MNEDTGPVVVTGGGSGIGRATALAFSRRGSPVAVADIDGERAQETAQLVAAAGGTAHAYPVDVGDADAMATFADTVATVLGPPRVVVLNAGIGVAGPLLDTTTADWERLLHVNVWGVIHGAQLFGQQMVERGRGGHIVVVASMAAFIPSRAAPAYTTTKAAVLMFAACLRAELAEHRIGVSAICPGFVDTGIIAAMRYVGVTPEQAERQRAAAARLFRRRRLGPDAVARAILDAVRHDKAVVAVGTEARLARTVGGLAAPLARRFARVDITPGRRRS